MLVTSARRRVAALALAPTLVVLAGVVGPSASGAGAQGPGSVEVEVPAPGDDVEVPATAAATVLYGRVDVADDPVRVRIAGPRDGRLAVQVLVPASAPEGDRTDHAGIEVSVTDLDEQVVDEVPVGLVLGRDVDPVAGEEVLVVTDAERPVLPGARYEVEVAAAEPTRVLVHVGEPAAVDAGPGAPDVDAAADAVAEWFATAPAAAPPVDAGGVRGPSPDTGAGAQRDVIGRSAGWGLLVAVLGAMALVSVLAWRPWRRSRQS